MQVSLVGLNNLNSPSFSARSSSPQRPAPRRDESENKGNAGQVNGTGGGGGRSRTGAARVIALA